MESRHIIELKDDGWYLTHTPGCTGPCAFSRLIAYTYLDIYPNGVYELYHDPGEDSLGLIAVIGPDGPM